MAILEERNHFHCLVISRLPKRIRTKEAKSMMKGFILMSLFIDDFMC